MDEHFENDILGPLSRSFYRQADELLDLREAALTKAHPGRCVSCYFKLFSSADGMSVAKLDALRRWLERNLIIEARDDSDQVLEKMPVCLDEEGDLEDYCRRLSMEVLNNRVYPAERIELRFNFKDATLAA